MVAKKKTGTKAHKQASGVIEIDLDNVEVRDVYDGEDPRPGFYTFELVNVGKHTSQGGNEGIRWVFALRDNVEYEGWTRFVYSNTLPKGTDGSSLWKTGEIMLALAGGKAVQGTKAGGTVKLDLNSEESVKRFLKKAKLVRGRVQRRRDSDDDDPEFELGKIIALDQAKLDARNAAKAALEDDEDEDEDGDEAEFDDADSEFEDADEEDDEDEDEDSDEDDEDSDDEDDDEEDEDEDEDEDDEEEDEDEEPAPPKKSAKKVAAKKAAPSKKASKVTNIADAKSKKAKKK